MKKVRIFCEEITRATFSMFTLKYPAHPASWARTVVSINNTYFFHFSLWIFCDKFLFPFYIKLPVIFKRNLYYYCPANRSSKKRGWLRSFLIGASAQGRRFGSAGLLDGLHRCPGRKILFTSCKRSKCPGAAGPEPGSSSPVSVSSCFLQASFFPGLLCACWPALS